MLEADLHGGTLQPPDVGTEIRQAMSEALRGDLGLVAALQLRFAALEDHLRRRPQLQSSA